jgi:FkbM family methyltransferase
MATTRLRRALRALLGKRPLTYLDCGARAGKLPRGFRAIGDTAYVGFEADAEECARLNDAARPHHRFVQAFLAGRAGRRPFHLTASPACASLLAPNDDLLAAFPELAAAFVGRDTIEVPTVTLQAALDAAGIHGADFLELDTGSEQEILEGAGSVLDGILGIRVEVEFAAMYRGQPLFADLDTYLRARGFVLFDLSRYRARRGALPADVPTRGQLLWGHALYLRDGANLPVETIGRLAAVAALVDEPDYAAALLAARLGTVDEAARPVWLAAIDAIRAAAPGELDRDGTYAAGIGRSHWRD